MEPTHFDDGTPEEVKRAIEAAAENGTRIRLWYGGKDGASWDEERHVTGKIGRSTGPNKIALLINNAQSLGGGAILTARIVKMVNTQTGRILCIHPKFKQGEFSVVSSDMPEKYAANVLRNGELYARCKNIHSANNLAAFMMGTRFSK